MQKPDLYVAASMMRVVHEMGCIESDGYKLCTLVQCQSLD